MQQPQIYGINERCPLLSNFVYVVLRTRWFLNWCHFHVLDALPHGGRIRPAFTAAADWAGRRPFRVPPEGRCLAPESRGDAGRRCKQSRVSPGFTNHCERTSSFIFIHTTLGSLIFMNINNTMSTPFIKQLTYIYKLSLEAEYLIIKIIAATEMKWFVFFFSFFLSFLSVLFFLSFTLYISGFASSKVYTLNMHIAIRLITVARGQTRTTTGDAAVAASSGAESDDERFWSRGKLFEK